MNPFLRVIEALNRENVRYVIVGGFAAVMHGLNRATQDLDLVIDLDAGEALKAINTLKAIGLTGRVPVDPADFADAAKRQQWQSEKGAAVFTLIDSTNPVFSVDLFLEYPLDFNGLMAHSKSIKIRETSVRICGIDDLIQLKTMSGRPQDLLDIQALTDLNSKKGTA